MILTGLKRKTNQIFFNKKLIEFQNRDEICSHKKVKKVLILLSEFEYQDEILKDRSEKLEIAIHQFQVMIFQAKKDKNNLIENAYYPSDFGWYGKINSSFITDILTKKFDLLINYNKIDNIYTNLLLLQCNSDFNVGFAKLNKTLFQLLIDCEIDDFKLFNGELKKYLTILKKLECKN